MEPSTSTQLESPWYVQAFDETYLRVYAHRTDAEAEARADGIVKLLEAGAGDRLLDVACGEGRYSRAMVRRGLRVAGLDLSRDLLQSAKERSPLLPGTPDYFRGDIRRLPFANQFEAAISMFTSFGYFDSRDDDLAVFRGVARALVRGGRFLIDYLNAHQVRQGLVPEESQDIGNFTLHIRRHIEEDAPAGPVVVKGVEIVDDITGAVENRFEERVRLYTPAEIDSLLADAGMRPVGYVMADTDGSPWSYAADRTVRLAEKR